MLIEYTNKQGKYLFSKEILEQIVILDEKQRYSYNEDKTMIRANQGHSIPVDVELKEMLPPKKLYHGTVYSKLESIKEKGLQKQSRNHVHLSSKLKTARQVGLRHGKDLCILEVDTENMLLDGYKFYLSENGVWLTDYIPNKYLKVLDL